MEKQCILILCARFKLVPYGTELGLGVKTLNREEAVSLLKEIMVTCISFRTAQVVSISKDKGKDGWVLSANWVPETAENECLSKITAERNLEVNTQNGCTVFR